MTTHPRFLTAALLTLGATFANAGDMVPFVLPFDDDAPSITDFSSLNHTPAGKFGFISVSDEGRFLAGDERIRFLGVNITADSCFPSQDEAKAIAGRLAKFGFNIVRFHHMDNNWGNGSIIDYNGPEKNSRALHAGNLERLDFFIAELKSRGIYVNLNLINSREFTPADGIDAGVTALDWKARHVLGFVDNTFRDLEKDYASQLLSHVNEYTGIAYADDPAIAVVEINNENGIFQQYFDGNIDKWPSVYKQQLQTGWNDWLQTRYASTEALLTAWSGESEPLGDQLISNPSFNSGTASWNIEQHGGAAVSTTTDTFDGRRALRANVTTAGSAGWHVQITQSPLAFEKDQLYTLRFWAKADSDLAFDASIQQGYDPWSTHHGFSGLQATNQWQEYVFVFYAAVSDTNLRLNFNGFGDRLGSFYLSDVTLRRGGDLAADLPDGESLEAANISVNARSLSYLPNRDLDWTRYLTAVALDYWTDMRNHIKQTLGYNGLVNGTTIMNSPPNIQSVFDFADTHAYWQHPVFPVEDWDPVDWYVNPVSMLNTVNTTIADLSRQRIDGLPHTVSEYRHAYPNPYTSEGPLIISAYGALQDWDGIYFFDYARGNSWDQGYFDNYFNMNAHPTSMANAAIAANLFRRGDVDRASSELLMNFSPEREIEAVAIRGQPWNVGDGRQLDIQPEHALVQRIALSIGDDATGLQTDPPAPPEGPVYAATNNQLTWDLSEPGKGVAMINTDRTKATIGFINDRNFELGDVRIEFGATQLDWATVALTMQNGSFASPTSGGQLLIVATGLAENTNMEWTDETRSSVGNSWGQAPTLIEAIPATITLPFAAELTQAWALDETGQRSAALSVTASGDHSAIAIGGSQKSLWYEVQIAKDPSILTYEEWADQVFSLAELEDVTVAGPLADPDGDSIPNLLEFLTSLDPHTFDTSSPITQNVEWRQGKPVFVYTFSMSSSFPTTNLGVSVSENLSSWLDGPTDSDQLTLSVTPASESVQNVRIEFAPDTYPAFSRLKATAP